MTVAENGIIKKANDYLVVKGKSITEFSKEINYSRTTLSRYLAGKYDSDTTEIDKKIVDYLASEGFAVDSAEKGAPVKVIPKFFESTDASGVIGVCSSSQQYIGLGIVVGKSGFGKTHTLKYYAKMPRVAYIECDDTMACRDLVEAIEKALGIPQTYGTIWKRVNGIIEFFNVNHGYVLIIDEADKLVSKYTQKKMEILRAIFDKADVGMVIAGEPSLEAQIKSYLARFANRVDFYHALHGLTTAEVKEYLSSYEINEDALSELMTRACNKQTGCFRLLDRTLKNVIRIMQQSGQEIITINVIAQASGMMML